MKIHEPGIKCFGQDVFAVCSCGWDKWIYFDDITSERYSVEKVREMANNAFAGHLLESDRGLMTL